MECTDISSSLSRIDSRLRFFGIRLFIASTTVFLIDGMRPDRVGLPLSAVFAMLTNHSRDGRCVGSKLLDIGGGFGSV